MNFSNCVIKINKKSCLWELDMTSPRGYRAVGDIDVCLYLKDLGGKWCLVYWNGGIYELAIDNIDRYSEPPPALLV